MSKKSIHHSKYLQILEVGFFNTNDQRLNTNFVQIKHVKQA